MLLRLIALLLTLGMVTISTQAACDLDTAPSAALVDAIDDQPFDAVRPAVFRAPAAHVVAAPTPVAQPPAHRPESSLFRPPRAALA